MSYFSHPHPTPKETLIAIAATVGIAAVVIAGATQYALGHEAPTGWSYPYSCCSNQDCREISDARITEGPGGYTVPSGETLAFSDRRIKDSPDGVFHWCSIAGEEDSRTICLFVPPRLF